MMRKTVRESQVETIEIVFPNDANPHGNIFGGRVMQFIDIVGSVSAMKHARRAVVTASMDQLDFKAPVKVGEVLILHASVNYVGRTSMEVGVKVMAENPLTGERRQTSTAYLTYVAVDEKGCPVEMEPIIPETADEKRRYKEAQARRKHRLEVREQKARAKKS
ncbi:MAG TPA: acyl-CoA thioesterase [Acidobacteriota bacterium]|nr:acyl-CoA thioesterase [Acidobacteriota bacterium]